MTEQGGSKEIHVRIASIGVFKTISGGIQEIQVETLDTKQMLDVSVFLNDGQWPFNGNDEVTMSVKQGKEYRGKTPWVTGLDKIVPIKTMETEAKESEMSKEDWAEKEDRSHRRACVAIAVGMLSEKDKIDFETMDVERVGIVLLTAEKIKQYVDSGVVDESLAYPPEQSTQDGTAV